MSTNDAAMEKGVRVALITGGAQGLGAAMARRLHADGLHVVVADLNRAGAEARATELSDGPGSTGLHVDVTDDVSVDLLMKEVAEHRGRLDVLINNAGTLIRGPASELDTLSWQRQIDVSLGGSMRCSRAAYGLLRSGVGANIINLASVASTFGLPLRLAYSAAKSGILGLTRTLAAEWGPDGIRVNAVAPGYVDTEMMRSGFELGVLDERSLLARTPLRRLGAAEEIAGAVSFLASADASFVTGTVLRVDGGITIDGDFRPQDALE